MDFSACATEPLPLEDILLRGRSGDREALTELIRRYQARIARFVIGQIGDDSHYEDLCQIIFVKMVLALPRLRNAARFEPWLFQIARNACRDHHRAKQGWRRLFVSYQSAHDDLPALNARQDRRNEGRLEWGLAQLPADQRSLLLLSLEEKRSYEDLARLSNSSISGVKSRLYRAREKLRAFLLTGEPNAEGK